VTETVVQQTLANIDANINFVSYASRSEYCRNVKLKYCLVSDAPWAKAFREKLAKQPSEGGFTGKPSMLITSNDNIFINSCHLPTVPDACSVKPQTRLRLTVITEKSRGIFILHVMY